MDVFDSHIERKINPNNRDARWEYLKSNRPDGTQFSGYFEYLKSVMYYAPNAKQALDIIKEVIEKAPDKRLLLNLAQHADHNKKSGAIDSFKYVPFSNYFDRIIPDDAHFTGGGYTEKFSKFQIASMQLRGMGNKSGVVYTSPENKKELELKQAVVKKSWKR